jgi:hypothetical protein
LGEGLWLVSPWFKFLADLKTITVRTLVAFQKWKFEEEALNITKKSANSPEFKDVTNVGHLKAVVRPV